MMATGDTVPPLALSSPPPPLLDRTPSNVSSPLSDVEDKDADVDEADLDLGDHSYVHGTPKRNGAVDDPEQDAASDSDESKLSEVDVNDSEAETERLYDTPPKNGVARDIVNTAGDAGHRRFTDRRDRVFERSPSKLHQQLQADIDAEDVTSGRNSPFEGDEDDDDDDVSMAYSEPDPDAAKESRPSSPTLAKKNSAETTAPQLTRKGSSESRKRKRPSITEQSDTEEPLKKRTGSIGAADRTFPADDIAMIDDGVSTNPQSGNHTAEEDENDGLVATTETKEELPDQVEEDVVVPTRSKKGKRSPTKKRKSKSPEEAGAQDEAPDEPPEDGDVQGSEVPTPHAEDDQVEGIDEEAEAAHRNEEERTETNSFELFTVANSATVERKKAAWDELIAIEKQFSSFRER